MYEALPFELRTHRNWVCARTTNKMPLRADTLLAVSYNIPVYDYKDYFAHVNDSKTWNTFDNAYSCIERGQCQYVGYVFSGNGIVGVDLDDAFEDGVLTDKAADIIDRCKSYTEISKSGNGIHILMKGHLPFDGSNNRDSVEIYTDKRFFILTGRSVMYKDLVENQEAIDWIISEHFSVKRVEKDDKIKVVKPKIYEKKVEYNNGKLKISYPPITPGSRNCCLASYVGSLLGRYPEEEIHRKTHKMNLLKCQPPLPTDEVDNIIRSIMKYSTSRGLSADGEQNCNCDIYAR